MAIFGGIKQRIAVKNFRGGRLLAICGGFDIDLTRADIEGQSAVIDASALMGGGEIRVPDSWIVEIPRRPSARRLYRRNAPNHCRFHHGKASDREGHCRPRRRGNQELIRFHAPYSQSASAPGSVPACVDSSRRDARLLDVRNGWNGREGIYRALLSSLPDLRVHLPFRLLLVPRHALQSHQHFEIRDHARNRRASRERHLDSDRQVSLVFALANGLVSANQRSDVPRRFRCSLARASCFICFRWTSTTC